VKDKHFVFVSSNYPSSKKPYKGAFVRNLIRTIAQTGIKCSVISPTKIYKASDPVIKEDNFFNNNPIKEIRPRTITFSNKNIANVFNTFYVTQKSIEYAVEKGIKYLDAKPDIFYGHFLYPSGAAALKFANNNGVPAFVAVGESNPNIYFEKGMINRKLIDRYKNVNGLIAVSEENKAFCIDNLEIPESKIGVFPNGINKEIFYPRDKNKMRKKFDLPCDKFLVIFVGHFIKRKGPKRLLKACENIDNIGIILVGDGDMNLNSDKIVFKDFLNHEKVPEILSAANLFVLPTLAEGSCNAIIEAMACGLPIVSSDKEFNSELLNEDFSVKVDPLNTNEIRKAILLIKNNEELAKKMSKNALKYAENFSVKSRAKDIIDFMYSRI